MLFAVEADSINPRGGMEVMEKRCGVDFSCYSLCFYSSTGYIGEQFGTGVPGTGVPQQYGRGKSRASRPLSCWDPFPAYGGKQNSRQGGKSQVW